jgi:hypothetical protein
MKLEKDLWRELKKFKSSINWTRLENRYQIAFFVRHPKNSFVLVAGSPDPELVRLYPGSRILELVDDGLRLEPLASGLAACVALFESLGA